MRPRERVAIRKCFSLWAPQHRTYAYLAKLRKVLLARKIYIFMNRKGGKGLKLLCKSLGEFKAENNWAFPAFAPPPPPPPAFFAPFAEKIGTCARISLSPGRGGGGSRRRRRCIYPREGRKERDGTSPGGREREVFIGTPLSGNPSRHPKVTSASAPRSSDIIPPSLLSLFTRQKKLQRGGDL